MRSVVNFMLRYLLQVIGVALNGIQNLGDIEIEKEKLDQANDEKYKNIFTFLYGINQDLDLFAKYRVDRIFECRILSVDQNYRGQGLAKQLLQKSLEIAEEQGFKVRLRLSRMILSYNL